MDRKKDYPAILPDVAACLEMLDASVDAEGTAPR